jgi:hypothetical protein
MKTKEIVLAALSCLLVTTCKKDDPKAAVPPPVPAPTPSACTPVIVNVSTSINSPTVWKECSVYVVGPTAISVNSSLIIEPGAIIKIQKSAGDNAILVGGSGSITAIGTADKPIIFTSFADDSRGGDSNGDSTASAPARYDWGGIIMNSSACVFKYCGFIYGGLGPDATTGQPTLEFSSFSGIIDNCAFAYCGGDTSYAGYGVVDARYCENPDFVITNSVFFGCIKPLFLSPHNSVDNSNMFHNPNNIAEKNQLNGIFMTSTSNEATTDVSWLENEVPFVLTGSTKLDDGRKLILGENVIIKVAVFPYIGYNSLTIKEGLSFIEGHDLPGVYFTSYLDDAHGGDTNGDGAATTPATGDWYGVLDNSAVIMTNNHCYPWSNILYAQYP